MHEGELFYDQTALIHLFLYTNDDFLFLFFFGLLLLRFSTCSIFYLLYRKLHFLLVLFHLVVSDLFTYIGKVTTTPHTHSPHTHTNTHTHTAFT